MKTYLFFSVFIFFCALNAQNSTLTECEALLKSHQSINKNSEWKDFTYNAQHGNIFYKEVEYFNSQQPGDSKKYGLFQLEETGYYYFGDIANDVPERKFYNNENDALVALFIWQCCKVYLDQGSVSETETAKINAQ